MLLETVRAKLRCNFATHLLEKSEINGAAQFRILHAGELSVALLGSALCLVGKESKMQNGVNLQHICLGKVLRCSFGLHVVAGQAL